MIIVQVTESDPLSFKFKNGHDTQHIKLRMLIKRTELLTEYNGIVHSIQKRGIKKISFYLNPAMMQTLKLLCELCHPRFYAQD